MNFSYIQLACFFVFGFAKVALQPMRIAPFRPRLIPPECSQASVAKARYRRVDHHYGFRAYFVAHHVAQFVNLRFGYLPTNLAFAKCEGAYEAVIKAASFDSFHLLIWNIKRTLVKIVLSYTASIWLAGQMKRPLDVHEVMALAILAGAIVHGILRGIIGG